MSARSFFPTDTAIATTIAWRRSMLLARKGEVTLRNEPTDVAFEVDHAAVGAAAQLAPSQLSEPAFNEVEPRAAGRGEMQVEPRVAQQPLSDLRGLVSTVVVADQV